MDHAPRELTIEVDDGSFYDPGRIASGDNRIRIDQTDYDVIARDGNTLTVREVIVPKPEPRQMIDVADWAKALEPNVPPVLNYLPKMEWSYPNHAGAIIGHTTPPHPVLARLLARPVRLLRRASDAALALAGYEDTPDDPYAECECVVQPSGRGLAGLAGKISVTRQEWAKTAPIYDPEKVKEIDAAFAKAHPRLTMQWGMSEKYKTMAKDYEDSIIRPRKTDEPDDQTENPILG